LSDADILLEARPMSDSAILELASRLRWLGHDSFLLTTLEGKRVYIDPYKLDSADLEPADFILITHSHMDHFSAPDVERLRKATTVFVTAPPVAKELAGAKALSAGESVSFGDLMITAVPAYNIDKFRSPGMPFHPPHPSDSPKRSFGVGFLVTDRDQTLYHAGDTDHIPEMAALNVMSIDVALLPVSGKYVMTADEAVAAAATIRPKLAIPMHYASLVGSTDDAIRFADGCQAIGIPTRVMSAS
jgi:L-ascorbate metabolism protein UlaG (beta-lactamase superfamily)